MKLEYGIPVPRGVRKDWKAGRHSPGMAGVLMRHYTVPPEWGDPIACVSWDDRFGRDRAVVAHYPSGRSATVRIDANGNWKTTFGQVPAPVGRSGEASETRSGSTAGEHAVPAQQEGAQPFISEEQP